MITSASAPLRMGKVVLTVNDLEAVGDYYQRVIGLHLLNKNSNVAQLGAGDEVLLELHGDPSVHRHSPREAGLFHTAFLLPSRSDLARWAQHAMDIQAPVQGASDHLVSEAIYLSDPEGNGIEIYADRPSDTWMMANGEVRMATEPLNFKDLMATMTPGPWRGAPAGTIVGHVHLQVGDLSDAEAFYKSVLGFDVMAHYPGALFFGSGDYHHHIGANIWNSRGAAQRGQPSTGLTEVTIRVNDAEILDTISTRATQAGLAFNSTQHGLQIGDPWGTRITLAVT